MRTRERLLVVVLAGLVLSGGLAVFLTTHRTIPAAAVAAEAANAQGMTMPTIDEMCASQGAEEGELLQQCQAAENAAGEYVVAWMGLQGFIVNGAIDVDQIQLHSELDETDPLLAPSIDPLVGGTPEVDPLTGEFVPGSFQSTAQVALFCLMSSTDWITLQNCIAQSDPGAGAGADLLGLGTASGDATAAGVQ
jgi:hypothetical protein